MPIKSLEPTLKGDRIISAVRMSMVKEMIASFGEVKSKYQAEYSVSFSPLESRSGLSS